MHVMCLVDQLQVYHCHKVWMFSANARQKKVRAGLLNENVLKHGREKKVRAG